MKIMDIKEEIEKHGNLPLECDGFTRVFEYLLKEKNINFQGYCGIIHVGEKSIKPHYWIVSDKYIVDYAISMWFGNSAPNGILEIEHVKLAQGNTMFVTKEGARYIGVPTSMETSKEVFEILTRSLKEE